MTAVVLLGLFSLQALDKAPMRPPALEAPASAYEQLLARYLGDDFDGAVAEVTRHPSKFFEAPFEQALGKALDRVKFETAKFHKGEESTPTAMYRAQDHLVRFLMTVMMLHTEASFRTSTEQVQGQINLAHTAYAALDAAERDLESHAPGVGLLTRENVDRARHDWVVLVALGFHARGMLNALGEHLRQALLRFPKDPPLELCLGVYYERVAFYGTVDMSLAKQIYPAENIADWRHMLEIASSAYVEAAKAPDLAPEAHLRTGFIRSVLGDAKEARSDLEPLTTVDQPPLLRYLALLMLGRVEEMDRQRDAAETRYLAALAASPAAQTPMLALSRLRDEIGDTKSAHAWLEKSFGLATPRRIDPWWYYFAPFVDIEQLTLSLRQQVRQ